MEDWQDLVFERLRGPEVASRVKELASLRIRVFREWPYLYEGDVAYEREYLQVYTRSPRSFVFFVWQGGEAVGASTAIPLADEDEAFREPFQRAGFEVENVFYFGESILLPSVRGRGLYPCFFDEREAHARSFGGYHWVTFCGVQRPDDHPRRPNHDQPLDPVWSRRGFEPRPDIVARFPWRDVGEEQETEKPLMFWLRELA